MKIYKQRKKGAERQSQMVSVLGTCAVMLGVGIFGYYVVAKPIWEIMTDKGDDDYSQSVDVSSTAQTTTQEVSQTEATQTKTTTVSSEKVTTTAPAETTQTTTQATTTTAPVTQAPVSNEKSTGGCYFISADDMAGADSLSQALNRVKEYKYAVVPLKVTGGKLLYASGIESANLSGAVSSGMTLSEIVDAIKKCGMEPAAEISTIADSIYPATYKKSAYQFADGVTGEWLDNKSESGGKPWMSPFADLTKSYLSDIIGEISSAGIKKIICTDTYFPAFRDKDIGYIGDIVKPETRYSGLCELINHLSDKAESNGASLMLEVSASDVINSSSEVFKPESYGDMYAVVNINMNDFGSQSISDIMAKIKSKSGSMQIVPCISGSSSGSLSSVIESLEKLGYDYYMVK